MQRAEANGSGGASQPAERTADASQLVGLPTVRLNLGVAEQDLHMLTLCKIWGHEKELALCEVVVHKKE